MLIFEIKGKKISEKTSEMCNFISIFKNTHNYTKIQLDWLC